MQVVIFYVFEGAQFEYNFYFGFKKKNGRSNMAAVIPQKNFQDISAMRVVIIYVFEGAQFKYHIGYSKKKLADLTWRPLYWKKYFLMIQRLWIDKSYVFEGSEYKLHIRFSKNKI